MTVTDPIASPVESIKAASALLRGDLASELEAPTPNVSHDAEQLLKFHGVYAQDDRDQRRARSLAGETLAFSFMIRVAIPGGRLTTAQWFALDAVADAVADGTIRLTTRQAVQFHGVAKHDLRTVASTLHHHLLTSFAACGDVVRNTVTCPDLEIAGGGDPGEGVASRIARAFKPATRAHWEIFVDGTLAASAVEDVEHDFYGETYLPRKFKIAVAHPDENCVDVYAQDLGLVPATHPELGPGFVVLVGGGLGRSYAQADTFARLADPLTFVTHDEVIALIGAVVETYRDLGDRTNRRRARMKYVVADGGLADFAEAVSRRYGPLRPPLVVDLGPADDHLGWRADADGRWRLGIRVAAGRVRDERAGLGLRSALREMLSGRDLELIITAQQDLIVAGFAPSERDEVERLLARHGVRGLDQLGSVERSALACPALPTCGQALAEAERVLPAVVDAVQASLDRLGGSRGLQLRLTGCPNGCARPALAEVGIVGRTKSTYDVYLGGGPRGDRLARVAHEKVKLDDLAEVLTPHLERWRDEGLEGESFGDFVQRVAAP